MSQLLRRVFVSFLLLACLLAFGCGNEFSSGLFPDATGGGSGGTASASTASSVAMSSSAMATVSSTGGMGSTTTAVTTGMGGMGGMPEFCGDGVKNGSELCDKNDIGGATCANAVAPGWIGKILCTAECKLDLSNCAQPSTTWNDVTKASNWLTFDVSIVNSGAKGFVGAAFDGKYLYFVPNFNGVQSGIVARFDPQGGFGNAASWLTFDVSTVNSGAKGFEGAAFDGKYLYLVPNSNANGVYDGIVARFDTQATFTKAASWSTFDVSTVNGGAKGFFGAAFDGKYLYLAPYTNGVVARFDTQAPFDADASWLTFDVSAVNVGAKGFIGAAFDGKYLYLVPITSNGNVTRFDTQAQFDTAASWKTFDVTTLNAGAKGFIGSAFDGKYLYLAPSPNGIVTRFDTQAAFDKAASWKTFDVSTVNGGAKGFAGAAFDGRHLYLAPNTNGVYDGIVTRFDTQAQFDTAASWKTFDVSSVTPGAKGFFGTAFDGKYLYLAPNYNGAYSGIVARFDAKSPPWLPKTWDASFF